MPEQQGDWHGNTTRAVLKRLKGAIPRNSQCSRERASRSADGRNMIVDEEGEGRSNQEEGEEDEEEPWNGQACIQVHREAGKGS